MSAEAVGWVFRHSLYTGDRFVIHLAIADVVNDVYDQRFWMTVGDVATKARCSARTVQYALKDMEREGYLEVVKPGGGRGKPTEYRMVFPERVQILHPLETVQSTAVKGANDDIPQLQTQSKPKLEDVVRDDFESLWRRYPKNTEKTSAFKRYLKLRHDKVAHADIVEGTRRYVRRCRSEGRELQFYASLAAVLGPKQIWKDELDREPIDLTGHEPSKGRNEYGVPDWQIGQVADA